MKLLSQADDVNKIFGTISPPPELRPFLDQDKTGAAGISLFLSNLITLIYSIAGVALIFMLIWGAFEWLISGGEKEKIASAQKRITSALIGIAILAIAFAVLAAIGQFTGFTFFDKQYLFNLPRAGQPPCDPSLGRAC